MNLTNTDLQRNSSILEKYKSLNKDMLYYAKPDSQDIYFMDFTSGRFVKEKITNTVLPYQFSTQ